MPTVPFGPGMIGSPTDVELDREINVVTKPLPLIWRRYTSRSVLLSSTSRFVEAESKTTKWPSFEIRGLAQAPLALLRGLGTLPLIRDTSWNVGVPTTSSTTKDMSAT